MFLAERFNDLELNRVMELPLKTLLKWTDYFKRMIELQQESIGRAAAPAKSVKEHTFQFR